MVFMGINEINFDTGELHPSKWDVIGQAIEKSGKECVVGLPPLINSSHRNQMIKAYNSRVADKLKKTNCKILDTSHSLSREKDLMIGTSDGLHFRNDQAPRAAKATCAVLNKVIQSGSLQLVEEINETPREYTQKEWSTFFSRDTAY